MTYDKNRLYGKRPARFPVKPAAHIRVVGDGEGYPKPKVAVRRKRGRHA